jgi:hypothetical protein
VGNGAKTSFWKDIWIRDVPLKTSFPELVSMCSEPDACVPSMWISGEETVTFRRSLTPAEVDGFNQLMQSLQTASPSADDDEFEWLLDKSKSFTTKSLYSFLTHRGVCARV